MLTEVRQSLQRRWSTLDPSLQRLLRWAAPSLLLVAIWSLVWVPCQAERHRLQQELPQLRQQLASMKGEAAALRQAAPPSSAEAMGLPGIGQLESGLQQLGLGHGQWQGAGPQWQLQLHAVSYSAWIQWVRNIADQYHLHVVKAAIRTMPGSGIVDVDAVIEQSAGQPE